MEVRLGSWPYCCDPSGVECGIRSQPGVSLALNPRLIAGNPPGCNMSAFVHLCITASNPAWGVQTPVLQGHNTRWIGVKPVPTLERSSLYTSPADPKTPSFRHGLPESRAMDGNLPLAQVLDSGKLPAPRFTSL